MRGESNEIHGCQVELMKNPLAVNSFSAASMKYSRWHGAKAPRPLPGGDWDPPRAWGAGPEHPATRYGRHSRNPRILLKIIKILK